MNKQTPGHLYGNSRRGTLTALGTATNGGGVASASLSLKKGEPTLPSKHLYEKLQKYCDPFLTRPHDELLKEFRQYRDELCRPFNPVEKYKRDVLLLNMETHITGRYDHETVKPNTLTGIFVNTCSRPGDLVVVPFAGSGTECEIAKKYGRNFVAFEIEEKHVKTARDRVFAGSLKPSLFLMGCHYITDKEAGRVFIPGCMGAAALGRHRCTCYNGRGKYKLTPEEKIKELEGQVKQLEEKIKTLENGKAPL